MFSFLIRGFEGLPHCQWKPERMHSFWLSLTMRESLEASDQNTEHWPPFLSLSLIKTVSSCVVQIVCVITSQGSSNPNCSLFFSFSLYLSISRSIFLYVYLSFFLTIPPPPSLSLPDLSETAWWSSKRMKLGHGGQTKALTAPLCCQSQQNIDCWSTARQGNLKICHRSH